MEGGVLTRRNCRKQSGPAGKVWKPVKFIRDGQLLLFLTALAVLVPVHARAADEGGNETGAPAFENVIRLPQDLYTQDGRLLEQGMYLVRAQFDEERPILVFESSDLEKTTIEGKPRERIRQGSPQRSHRGNDVPAFNRQPHRNGRRTAPQQDGTSPVSGNGTRLEGSAAHVSPCRHPKERRPAALSTAAARSVLGVDRVPGFFEQAVTAHCTSAVSLTAALRAGINS